MSGMNDGGARMNYDTGAMRETSTNKGAYEWLAPYGAGAHAIWLRILWPRVEEYAIGLGEGNPV